MFWWIREVYHSSDSALAAAVYDRPKSKFSYTRTLRAELTGCCARALQELEIDEDAGKVVSTFIAGGFLEGYYDEEERIWDARKKRK